VRTGVLAADGELLLFADADGATPIAEEAALAAAIGEGADVAVGSRLLRAPAAERSRVASRALGGRLFAGLAWRLFGLPVRDPQCGFKMFRREVGRRLFSLSSEPGYLFDLELLILARRLGYRIAEVPVSWHEIPGGHFRVSQNVLGIVAGLWRLCRRKRWEDE
jgi:dolichyl-phosphate beta-glucosyltransferase